MHIPVRHVEVAIGRPLCNGLAAQKIVVSQQEKKSPFLVYITFKAQRKPDAMKNYP